MHDARNRKSVDLSDFPDLVMIMLGFKLRSWRGLLAMRRIGIGLKRISDNYPEGLLSHEGMMFGLTHLGFRQYWKDLDHLERFTRSEPHSTWWTHVRELSAAAGFWHETYHANGGVEALYVGMQGATGLQRFAPERRPVGPFMSARARIQGGGTANDQDSASAPLTKDGRR
ncbi:DUF4188 domain-containing protein [Sphingomonas sp. ASV193]|uniref:monooxygenase family protein n=1 Tax=Sphingomonas sp. ASV193 TaxID=3144405 RepID=UPI0032E874A5